MKLQDIFEKDVTRPIDGVIKADDTTHLGTEVDEYVLTKEAETALSHLLEEYTNYTNANGVWISGFFGSGKSHLLKMLAHLLGDVEGQDFPRAEVSDSFECKTADHFLKASLKKAEGIPGRSLLFNIDQVADAQGGDKTDAILKVFIKVFNNSRGYYGMQPHVASFERDLDSRGLLKSFTETYGRIAGIPWTQGRELDVLEEPNVAAAYAEISGATTGAPENILQKYRDSYRVDIDGFASEIVAWLDKQESGTRLNFFVDEVGQYIGDDGKLMLSLETIAEALNTKAGGRAWVFVTSQEAMDKVIGDRTKSQEYDFSKIQARFKTRISLSSADVEEVIRKRLLEKNAPGARALKAVFEKESGNFKTLFDFVGGKTYPNFTDEKRFVSTYPFVNYQFPLFSTALIGLSEHNAFTGRHASVGERSMLGVVQQVAKELDGAEIGQLASFDHLFAGIRDTVQSATKKAIDVAEKNLPDQNSDLTKLAVRVLKALFLVKYVDGFRATSRNLAVLVYDRFGTNPQELTKQVEDALALLEAQTYIQRNGDQYEYLTNEEQEVENEIKTVDLDGSEVNKRLFEMLSQDVIKTPKYRHRTSKGDFLDYSFGYKVDDISYGPQHPLTVHFFTPGYVHDLQTIRAHSTGLDEVRVVIDADAGLFSDLRLLLKTEKYVKQKLNTSGTVQQRIIAVKAQQAQERKKELLERLRRAIGKAILVVWTVDVESASEVADTRVFDGLGVLVTKAYPQLSMLGGKVYVDADIQKYVQAPTDGMVTVDTALTEPANEVFNVGILAQARIGQQVTVKSLVDKFSQKPYGWDLTSTLVVIAYLFGSSRITIEHNGNVLKRTEAPPLLRNTQQLANLKVGVQKSYDEKKVTAFRKFVQDFFDEGVTPKDALDLAHFGADKLKDQLTRLQEARSAYDYPFIAGLDTPIALLGSVVGKTDEWYLTDFDQADELLEQKESVLDPIRSFLIDPHRKGIYDKVRKFLSDSVGNLGYLPNGTADEVRTLLEDRAIFRGNKLIDLKAAADTLESKLDHFVREEIKKATNAIGAKGGQLQESEEFELAPEDARQEALADVSLAMALLEQETDIAKIRLEANTFTNDTLLRLLSKLLAAQAKTAADPEDAPDAERPRGDEAPAAPQATPKPAPLVKISTITVPGAKLVLTSESDVDEYVAALRAELVKAIQEGKRLNP